MPSLKTQARREQILRLLRENGRVRVAELAQTLGVSQVTIRADLEALERQGVLRRLRGGAIPWETRRFELPLEVTRTLHAKEKEAIGKRAANLVKDGDVVILDVGSTTTEMAKALSPALKDVVVVTNALNIALLLEGHPGITVIVTGGKLRPLQHSLVNPFGTLLLEELNADKAFLGCNGVHPERGFTNTNLEEAEIKKAMVRAAREVYFLADHSKLLQVAAAKIAPLSAATRLITDKKAHPEALRALEEAGLRVELA
ncbi:DeoR/GlpR family DNA-binding transcription regulator [Thermus thermophilus]|uniref:Transcriptional regulator, DeoR family n=1 Tax=Thermus thermophilus (strain SG0.5JP17-16) TaxID=762633 RepID=F6DJM3_THETG|nr:DeoR/GlpR family DNA-binding transcription regulator [Thermus thermophilus]AEG34620.1 transcriptional regulator, DeoR family [Thermus thermophilus SG0.5JP17-16]NHK39520.1 DeoR/GlpR transcriptional regulator [Thermus thermophilus]